MNIIFIGGGQVVYFLAQHFISRNHRITIINRNPDQAKWLSEQVQALLILGDGSDPTMPEEAGARRTDVVVALTPRDQDNLVACQLARQMYGVPRTVALANDPENEAVFARLGVSATFSPVSLIASLIENL